MTVAKTLRECLLRYPCAFGNKWGVYHLWFVVNGNGYEWIGGELVCRTQESTLTDIINLHFDDLLFEVGGIKEQESHVNYCRKQVLGSVNWEEKSKDFEQMQELYPIGRSSKILNIPGNIKPDWREAVIEMYRWLLKHYDTIGAHNQKWVDKITIT